MNNVREASDLDHVIAAHETFLDQVMTRSLLDNESRVCTAYFQGFPNREVNSQKGPKFLRYDFTTRTQMNRLSLTKLGLLPKCLL